MQYNVEDVFEAAKKYKDLTFKKIDLDIYVLLKGLIYDLAKDHSKMWSFPPAGFIDNITKRLKNYDAVLTESLNNNYPLNGDFILGMAELLEKIVEDNMKYVKPGYRDKILEMRDRASSILVMVRLFEMEDIDTY